MKHPRRPRRRVSRAALLALLVLFGVASTLVTAALPVATAVAAPSWVEGRSDQDTIESCVTHAPVTGVMASVAWRPLGDHVPRVGERFVVRATAALVGQPCSGGVNTFVELMAPAGLIYGDDRDHPLRWGVRGVGDPVELTTGGLVYEPGSHGGVVVLRSGHEPFVLRRGEVLDLEVPVIATKVMKGKATREPECLDRREGIGPCRPEESGDHFQAAFRVHGHGGDKSYVTPYVGLFAQERVTAGKASSRTTATYQVKRRAPGRARVVVRSALRAPTGAVVVRDGRRVLARSVLRASDRGRTAVRLPRLGRGVHRLSVTYTGSTRIAPSTSATRRVTVR